MKHKTARSGSSDVAGKKTTFPAELFLRTADRICGNSARNTGRVRCCKSNATKNEFLRRKYISI